MRGEERKLGWTLLLAKELPPHARRRAEAPGSQIKKRGITSACAEKSSLNGYAPRLTGNSLRMRGEESDFRPWAFPLPELPPHARRRADDDRRGIVRAGITSACAEKRKDMLAVSRCCWNYLRMRGEEHHHPYLHKSGLELPPHARRRGMNDCDFFTFAGITSACAEKSQGYQCFSFPAGNYLRMRGEELSWSLAW